MSIPARQSRCRDCGARVMWARSESGERIPVDPEPESRGDLLLVTTETGKLLALAPRFLRESRVDGFSRQSYHGYGYDGLGERLPGRYVAHRASCHAGQEPGETTRGVLTPPQQMSGVNTPLSLYLSDK